MTSLRIFYATCFPDPHQAGICDAAKCPAARFQGRWHTGCANANLLRCQYLLKSSTIVFSMLKTCWGSMGGGEADRPTCFLRTASL